MIDFKNPPPLSTPLILVFIALVFMSYDQFTLARENQESLIQQKEQQSQLKVRLDQVSINIRKTLDDIQQAKRAGNSNAVELMTLLEKRGLRFNADQQQPATQQ